MDTVNGPNGLSGQIRFVGLPPLRPRAEVRPGDHIARSQGVDPGPASTAQPFGDYLTSAIGHVNKLQKEADLSVAAVATGQSGNLHEMMIALDKADLSFRALTRVRSKVLDAYQEIMRMQI